MPLAARPSCTAEKTRAGHRPYFCVHRGEASGGIEEADRGLTVARAHSGDAREDWLTSMVVVKETYYYMYNQTDLNVDLAWYMEEDVLGLDSNRTPARPINCYKIRSRRRIPKHIIRWADQVGYPPTILPHSFSIYFATHTHPFPLLSNSTRPSTKPWPASLFSLISVQQHEVLELHYI
jgi:hypothetical protein